jgi:hypothetical protein
MTDATAAAETIRRQLKELDQVVALALKDLNAVRGMENIEKWKARTAALLRAQVGEDEALRFAMQGTGPAFANDLQEEMQDKAEDCRTFLLALIEELGRRATPPPA